MNKILPVHHSVVDWDFEQGSTNRSLSAERFISAPTSLRIKKPLSGGFFDTVLCRIPETQLLPQGEVRTWNWTQYYSGKHVAIFRNQAALGSANYTNCYQIYATLANAYLDRYIGGVFSRRDSTTCIGYKDTWVHYRIFWYNGETPGEAAALCVDVYVEIGGEWIKQGNTLYDTSNTWKNSAINRAGFKASSENNQPQYWDDTEIWGPV